MAKRKEVAEPILYDQAPAATQMGRDMQLGAYAMALAEERLKNGTASNQLIVEMMRRSDPKEKLQIKKLEKEIELLDAKTEYVKSGKETERLYAEAIEAMKRYTPQWKE